MLDAIAEAMSQGEIGIRPTRSQLVTKAIQNFIRACESHDRLKEAIETVRMEFEKEASIRGSKVRNEQRLKVVPPAS